MDEIAGFRGRGIFAARAPADFANARQDVGDRLLLTMMVNAGAGSRLDLEQAAPQHRVDAELWRDCCLAYGAWRLCRCLVEPGRADNADGGIGGHILKGSWLMMWVVSVGAAHACRASKLQGALQMVFDLRQSLACKLPEVRVAAVLDLLLEQRCIALLIFDLAFHIGLVE